MSTTPVADTEVSEELRIDDLARAAGATVRNVRAYQDRGLLDPPRREGRVALYNQGGRGQFAVCDEKGGRLETIVPLLEGGPND